MGYAMSWKITYYGSLFPRTYWSLRNSMRQFSGGNDLIIYFWLGRNLFIHLFQEIHLHSCWVPVNLLALKDLTVTQRHIASGFMYFAISYNAINAKWEENFGSMRAPDLDWGWGLVSEGLVSVIVKPKSEGKEDRTSVTAEIGCAWQAGGVR